MIDYGSFVEILNTVMADNDLSEATVATSGAISSLGIKKLIIR